MGPIGMMSMRASFMAFVHGEKRLGNQLPGPGVVYMSQSLRFRAPVRIGDIVHARVTVKEVFAEKCRVVLDTVCTVLGKVVIDGEAMVMTTSRAKREAAGK